MKEFSLSTLNITPMALSSAPVRLQCPQCSLLNKLYCRSCAIPLDHVPPNVTLPFNLDMYL
ncbi:hypothetical protein HK096_004039 [Nowakowskiella sp. JEL0078]|nr:hypothetical protein HK096_004039 [Nowakowskiella sp. JEL0078]